MPPNEDGQSLDDLAGMLAPKKKDGDGGTTLERQEPVEDAGSEGHEQPADTDELTDDTGNPDEGTGDEGADEGEGEEQQGNEGDEEPSAEPFYTVKIDGKDERVTLKEALAGYQRQADYTRKTQEIADARRAADNEAEQARTVRTEYAKVLTVIQARLGDTANDRTHDQWNALRAQDPAAYATEWADHQRVLEQRGAVKQEQDRIAGEQKADDLNKLRVYVAGEQEKLHAALPILKDPEKGKALIASMREAALGYGFNEKEVGQVFDSRIMLLLNDARQWRSHQAALAKAKTKLKDAPQLPEPGSRQPQQSRKTKARADQLKTARKSGRVEDMVGLLVG